MLCKDKDLVAKLPNMVTQTLVSDYGLLIAHIGCSLSVALLRHLVDHTASGNAICKYSQCIIAVEFANTVINTNPCWR